VTGFGMTAKASKSKHKIRYCHFVSNDSTFAHNYVKPLYFRIDRSTSLKNKTKRRKLQNVKN